MPLARGTPPLTRADRAPVIRRTGVIPLGVTIKAFRIACLEALQGIHCKGFECGARDTVECLARKRA
jgi:hypothetical protein